MVVVTMMANSETLNHQITTNTNQLHHNLIHKSRTTRKNKTQDDALERHINISYKELLLKEPEEFVSNDNLINIIRFITA